MVAVRFRFYATASGRSPPLESIRALPEWERGQVLADLKTVSEGGRMIAASVKAIKGSKGLFEIRTLGFRTYCVRDRDGITWVVGFSTKQGGEQAREIERATKRARDIE